MGVLSAVRCEKTASRTPYARFPFSPRALVRVSGPAG